MRILIFALALLASCARVPEGEFSIEGRVDGLADSAVVRLIGWEGDVGFPAAVDTIVGGRPPSISMHLPGATSASAMA